jgi:uncharacterized protein YabE (DUF348 family)
MFLASCQTNKTSVIIQADGRTYTLTNSDRVPEKLISMVGVTIGLNDRVLYLGSSLLLDSPLPNGKSYTLTVRRAVTLTITVPDGIKTIQTSAFNVGQALSEAGYSLFTADQLNPTAETPINGPMTVSYQPSREISITIDGRLVRSRSAANSVGQALTGAGIPLTGLDYSLPEESAPLPEDGQIRVVRVVESVSLTQKPLPFNTRTELSTDLEIDQQALIQGGEPGLAITRIRTRSADGVQIMQKSESESIVLPAQDRIMGIGTKIVIRSTSVDGVTIEYWRVLHLFATSYSPCGSGTSDGRCLYGTSSGLPVQKGVVAMAYYWYLLFGFDHVYIPGYGQAIVGDVGSGYQGSHYWIDLGYSDSDYVPWDKWVTVYFLTPVPANPGYLLP